ncbi:fatty acid desaturase [Anabaena minutissima FACHB-250]|nr:fatty acid desaturase [Anabaena minutissima FACHB-250]
MLKNTNKCPNEYIVTDDDASQYIRDCTIAALILVAAYGLFITEFISSWVLFVIVAVTLPRWVISVHELLHVKDEKQINKIIKCLGISPIPLSIVTLSYPQMREIHQAHHRSPATESDPDAYHIRGNFLVVMFNALSAPEQSFIRSLQVNGFNLQLGLDLLIKLLILGILVFVGGEKFFWFWLFIRIVYGLGDIVFFRLVHHQKGQYGTFEMKIPSTLETWGERIFGATVVQATINHDVHHQNPGIAARHLATARPYIMISSSN